MARFDRLACSAVTNSHRSEFPVIRFSQRIRQRSLFRRPFSLLVTLLFALCASFSFSASASADEISVNLRTIYAATGEAQVDTTLSRLRDELRRAFPGFQRFTLLEQQVIEIPLGESRSRILPDSDRSELVITYSGVTEDKLLALRVGLKGKIAADVKASSGSTFFQAGLAYEDGILILAIEPKRRD